MTMSGGNLDQRLVNPFYGQRLRLSQRKALLFLCFKGNITGISILIVNSFKRPVIQTTNLAKGLGDGRSSYAKFHRDVWRRYRVCSKPDLENYEDYVHNF